MLPNSSLAPLALFAFNRIDLARTLVASLEETAEWRDSIVYVFVDGARNEVERIKTEEVRSYFEHLDHPHLTVVARDKNVGLKASLSSGIQQVCEQHSSVIVLEDDLQLSPDALRYFNSALTAYRDDRRVWSICGDVPDLKGYGIETAHFMPVGSSWGWATWANRWSSYDGVCRMTPSARNSRAFRDRFNVHGLRRFDRMLAMEEAGYISSWYVHWQLAISRSGGLSLFPPVPMVRNNGFGAGTHSSKMSLPNLFGLERKTLGRMEFSLPTTIEIDFDFTQRVIDSREWKLLRFNARIGQLRRKIRKGLVRAQIIRARG